MFNKANQQNLILKERTNNLNKQKQSAELQELVTISQP